MVVLGRDCVGEVVVWFFFPIIWGFVGKGRTPRKRKLEYTRKAKEMFGKGGGGLEPGLHGGGKEVHCSQRGKERGGFPLRGLLRKKGYKQKGGDIQKRGSFKLKKWRDSNIRGPRLPLDKRRRKDSGGGGVRKGGGSLVFLTYQGTFYEGKGNRTEDFITRGFEGHSKKAEKKKRSEQAPIQGLQGF